MKTLITGALAALTMAGATLATTTPAAADGWRGDGGGRREGGWRGGDDHRDGWRGGDERREGWRGGYGGGGYGLAVGAGLLGLAAGAAIADRPQYYAPGYAYGYGYPAPYAYGGCRTVWRYDPYVGHDVPVRRCW